MEDTEASAKLWRVNQETQTTRIWEPKEALSEYQCLQSDRETSLLKWKACSPSEIDLQLQELLKQSLPDFTTAQGRGFGFKSRLL